MSELTLNDDGTITMPLRPVIGAEGPHDREPLQLPEPSMEQLAEMHTIARAADESIPPIIQVPDPQNATVGELQAATDRLRERASAIYQGDMPYGQATIKLIKILRPDANVGMADLPAWCANPATINAILTHFQTPLVG